MTSSITVGFHQDKVSAFWTLNLNPEEPLITWSGIPVTRMPWEVLNQFPGKSEEFLKLDNEVVVELDSRNKTSAGKFDLVSGIFDWLNSILDGNFVIIYAEINTFQVITDAPLTVVVKQKWNSYISFINQPFPET